MVSGVIICRSEHHVHSAPILLILVTARPRSRSLTSGITHQQTKEGSHRCDQCPDHESGIKGKKVFFLLVDASPVFQSITACLLFLLLLIFLVIFAGIRPLHVLLHSYSLWIPEELHL